MPGDKDRINESDRGKKQEIMSQLKFTSLHINTRNLYIIIQI